MERTPVRVDRPECFANYLDIEDCSECEHRRGCIKLTRRFKRLKTITYIASRKQQSVVSTKSMLSWLSKSLAKKGYKYANGIPFSKKYQTAIASIIAQCQQAGVDPKIYLQAQIDTIGIWAINNNRMLYANMLQGKNAQGRFEEWSNKNRQKYGDHHHEKLSPLEEDLQAAETMFVAEYMSDSSLKAKDVEKQIQRVFPRWSLAKTRKKKRIRFEALRAWLASKGTLLPNRLCLRAETWTWGQVRKEIHRVL